MPEMDLRERAKRVVTLITDVDGVLTDGGFYYDSGGKVLKKFGPHDSDGFKAIKRMGIDVGAVTADARGFQISRARMDDMGIDLVLVADGQRNSWLTENFDPSTTAFVGDGMLDAESLGTVVLGFAPANATRQARMAAHVLLDSAGGHGVILEVAERLEALRK
jgi:3-deoxy-D-manno-octulosonate 8-phosphate phosphatase (KDO 8-P phosphatase)